MALGSSWGTREEMLHPRDRHGRFRKKWKMPEGVINKLQAFLERFNPRTFQSDQQASQYLFNRGKPGRFPGADQKRLHMDWDEANDHIRAGDIDPSTQKFIDMMEGASVPMQEQLILHRTVGPEAFGLTPDQLGLEDGGLQDFTGRLIADRAYGATNIGTPMGTGPGRIHMTIATPRGQQAIIPATTPNDRRVFLPRDQGLRITKVEPDGTGGWHVMAIAEPKGVARKTPEPVMPGRRGAGLSEAQREARITPTMTPEQRQQIAQQNEREMQTGVNAPTPAPVQPAPTQTAPAPASPAAVQGPTSPATGVPERQESVLKEQVGPTATEGASPAEVAQAGDEAARQAAEVQATPVPATPESFRQAFKEANPPAPSRGKRQKEYNDALGGIVSGKTSPEEALRQLDTDIEVNKRQLERQKAGTEKVDPELERDIQAQEALADLISSHSGAARRGQEGRGQAGGTPSAPTKAQGATPRAPRKAAAKKAGPTPTPGAPSTSREATPKAPEPAPDRRTKKELLEEAGDAGRARMTKAQLLQAIEHKKARGAEPPQMPLARKDDGTAVLTPDQERRIVDRAKGFRGKEANDEERRIVGLADDILARQGKAPVKKAAPAKAVAKKAVPVKAAPTPEDAAEEAFKARVAEAGLPDRVTALRAMAKEQKIRGFSTMNKRQLQSALLGDEVPKAGKIGVVPPAKMIPHLEAAKSDQDARALLEKHTLVDLRELAKSRELEIPKRGATKDRLKDMILTDIRGEQEGIQGRTPDTGLEEDLSNLGYISLPGPNGEAINAEIDKVQPDSPEALRRHRDNLEALSKKFRADGDKNAANMAQAAADAMGMRAQTISGVEEATPPVKRVAKKAVPEADVEPPPKTLDNMLKDELEAVARTEGVPGVRKSMTKAQLKDAIEKNRRMDSSRGGETEQERIRRELGALPGGPERDLGPSQGPLRLPNRAPTPEEIAQGNAEIPAPAKKTTKKAAKKAVADVERAAEALAPQLKGTFGDQLKATDPAEMRDSVRAVGLEPKGNTSEEMFDNALKDMLESRMRELGMLPEDPKKPTRAQKRVPKGSVPGRAVTTPDRKQSFREGWDGQKLQATGTSAGSLDEVRDDIESGKITPEEGVRRLDSDILFNEDESNDLLAQLEGMEPDDRENSDLNLQRAQLEENIRAQKKAKTFIRAHFKDEAPVTRQELEIQLDGPERAALDRVEVDDLKQAARNEGLGDIQGDDKDTVIQNIAKAVEARKLRDRAVKKAAPVAVPEAPATSTGPRRPGQANPSASSLKTGTRILTMQDSDGKWTRTSRKTGSKPITVDRIDRVQVGNQSGYQIHGTDDDGNKVTMEPIFGQNTLTLAPEKVGVPEAPAPAKKAAKAAVPVKAAPAPPPVVDLDNPTRHDAELIGTGLDLEPRGADRDWLGIVQRDLDRGTDGRQIANDLRREADSQRTIHNIQEAIAPGTGGPAGRIDRMERMADRLEGVRPIEAPAPAKVAPSGPAKREMGTMAAATAQSRALSDLKAGKSHAEVATALRQAATSVGSKDHDPQFVRPLEFSPAERTSMKRADAKSLRELAAEIQAQGVAQRAEARAAKKAASPAGKKAAKAQAEFVDRMAGERAAFKDLGDKPAKKAAPGETIVSPAVDRMVRQGGTLPGQTRRLSELREAAPPKEKLPSARELRLAQSAADSEGVPVSEVLARWAKQREERKNLTGPVGEMIKAQLDDAMRRLQEAKTPGQEDSALAGLLAPELRQLATRLGLDSKGSKATLLQRIKDRVKGREAPGASAERAVPKN